MAAAGVGGAIGGYGLTDWLLDKRRKQQLKSELETAKQVYHAALMKQGELGGCAAIW